MEKQTNLGDIFARHVGSGRVAVVELGENGAADRQVTYEALDAGCNAVARGLEARGIRRGDPVAILAVNSIEHIEALYGSARAGAVVVPLNRKTDAETIASVCKDAGVKLLFVDAACLELAPPGIARIHFESDGDDSYRAFCKPGPYVSVTPRAGEAAILLYTSGSTGAPKGVLLDHRGQAWAADIAGRAFHRLASTDRMILASPLYHVYGLQQLQAAFDVGIPVAMQRAFDARSYIEAIARLAITRLTGVAAMYTAVLAETALLDATDVTTVSGIGIGASPYSQPLVDALTRRWPSARVRIGYGSTEAGGGAFMGDHADGRVAEPGSLGWPLPGVELRLVEGEGDDEGFLLLRHPGVMLGYHNRPEETAKRLRDGWLDTRDLFRRAPDGSYWFAGRADDMFKCAGENVYPRQVEALLERHPDVARAVVVSVPHEGKGLVPVAFVVPRAGASPSEEAIREWTLANGPAFQHPRRVFIEAELPLNGTMKVDVGALRARARAMTAAADR